MENNYVVIMAGGVGSRFWPYSREKHPKQFLDILGTGSSLLRMTFERFNKLCPVENIYIVTNSDYNNLVKSQLPELGPDQILLETFRKNTAPCIAYASYKIQSKNPNANIVVTPADHAIFKEDVFLATVNLALESSKNSNRLVTLGIQPSRPDTGYGYIKFEKGNEPLKKVINFTEKPNKEKAREFLDSGDYVWNAGIFIWNVNAVISALEKHLPETARIFKNGLAAYYSKDEQDFVDKAYAQCDSISIDYGLMEKSDNVYVVLGDFSWSDLGSWATLHEIRDKDADNNVVDANALIYDCDNCAVIGPKDKLIVAQGLKNYLITYCDNVILICDKDNEKQFRTFVADVKEKKGSEFS